MNNLIYYLLPIIGWSLPNFFIKKLRNIFDSSELIVIFHLTYSIFIFSYIFILYLKNKQKFTNFVGKINNLTPSILSSILVVVIFGLGAQYGFNTILKNYDVTYSLPIISSLSSILLVVVGYFIFNESITFKRLIGILSTIIGVYLIMSS